MRPLIAAWLMRTARMMLLLAGVLIYLGVAGTLTKP